MKIRTEKDVEILKQRIDEEFGIDVEKYKNEEVAENFVDLMTFPIYAFNWTIRPVLVAFVLYVIGFWVVDLVDAETFFYAIIGFFLFLLTGFLLGLLLLTWKIKNDLWSIVEYTMNIMKEALTDIDEIKDKISPENRNNKLALLFKGILHIVTVPLITEIVSEKVPVAGGMINGFIKRVVRIISDRLKFDESDLKKELQKGTDEPGFLDSASNTIASASKGMDRLMDITFGVARFPLKVGFALSSILLILFLYLIW